MATAAAAILRTRMSPVATGAQSRLASAKEGNTDFEDPANGPAPP